MIAVRLRVLAAAVLLTVALPAADLRAQQPDSIEREPFDTWLEALKGEALAAGISPATVQAALGSVELQPIVIDRDRGQAEFTFTLGQYVARRLTPATVRLAIRRHREHQALLRKVERAHGVPTSVITSVWALESNFGRFAGVRPTVSVLATLAYDGRRATLFRNELLDALRIVDRGDIELDRLRGSWAGAMGQPQFLPSSYLKYAQDFDEDGRRDIWTSLPDVFASIGYYLKENGWAEGERWGRRVRLPANLDRKLAGRAPLRTTGCRAVRQLTEPLPLAEWRRAGVRTASGAALPRADMTASLLQQDGETFLVYRNYEALLRYNCAHSYALSVALLSDRLEGRMDSWPATARKTPARRRR